MDYKVDEIWNLKFKMRDEGWEDKKYVKFESRHKG